MKFLFGLLIIFLSLWLCVAQSQQAKREFVIDTDVGIDDAIAILYMLQRPEIKVKAITIESDGNAHCDPAFANTQSLLQLVHQTHIPVACGRLTPLHGGHSFPEEAKHACDTFGEKLLPKPYKLSSNQTAKDLLIKTLRSSKQAINILAIGPMTTLAEVIEQQPELKNKIRMIYAMAGAIYVPGNITSVDPTKNNHVAEWNVYFDPAAAKKVFHSNIPITLIPLDATNQVPFNKEFYERIKQQHVTPAATFVYQWIGKNKRKLFSEQSYFWDPVAAVVATNAEIATIKTLPLFIRLSPESLSGATVVDKKQGSPIHVCMNINNKKFENILLNGLNSR